MVWAKPRPGNIFCKVKGFLEWRQVIQFWLHRLWLHRHFKKRDGARGAGQAAARTQGHLHKVHLSLHFPYQFHSIILQTINEMGSPLLLFTLTAPIPREKASFQTTNQFWYRREANKDKANLKMIISRLFTSNWQVLLSKVNTSQPSDY